MDGTKLDLDAEFPTVTYDDWRKQAEADLKGAPFEKKLVGQTFEGIAIQPLYTPRDWDGSADPSGFPGFDPLTRGCSPLGAVVNGWDIRQEHASPEPADANRAILNDLVGGVSSVQIRLDAAACAGLDADSPSAADHPGQDGVLAFSSGDFARLLEGVQLDIAPISVDGGAAFLATAALLASHAGPGLEKARLSFNADPIGTLVRDGRLSVPVEEALEQLADLAAWTVRHAPASRAVEVGTGPYHHAGASSTQDLAFALATAVDYLRAMARAGLTVDQAASQVAFGISLGTHFFKAIAKLRALRLLWSKVVLDSGGSDSAAGRSQIRARTSRRVMTAFDPWVNLLRNTVCGFAGAVGGADVVTTSPMDAAIGPPDDFTRRLARNTQVILLEESRLNRVLDPAGGSWFLETLTGQLAEKAWELFRQVEAEGGMLAAVRSGWVARQIDAVEKSRQKDLATRKQVVTGVSEHPNVHEESLDRPRPDRPKLLTEAAHRLSSWKRDHPPSAPLESLSLAVLATTRPPGSITQAAVAAATAGATVGQLSSALASRGGDPATLEPLPLRTYAAAYEELRAACEAHVRKTGQRPRVFLANLGKPAEFIARSTFALNFFEAGGFEEINNEGFPDADSAASAFKSSGAKIAILCSTDPKYDELAVSAATALKASGARTVVLAGSPGANESKYRDAGIDRFIFIRCDVLGTLRDLLREEGVLR